MDDIYNALSSFKELCNYTYNFKIAYKKNIYNIKLKFRKSDFHHCVGLQYLKDIDIPKDANKLFEKIENGKINDKYLSKSKFYKPKHNHVDVENRIYQFQFLRNHIESNNLVFHYIKRLNPKSKIDAEYMITSKHNLVEAYMFIRIRKDSDGY